MKNLLNLRTCIFIAFAVVINFISRFECLNSTDCGKGQYLSDDGECMPCGPICSRNNVKRHRDICNYLCPNFSPEAETSPSHTKLILIAGPVAVGVVVSAVVMFFVIKRWRNNRRLSNPIQETHETQVLQPNNEDTRREEEEEEEISIGNTSTIPESDAQS